MELLTGIYAEPGRRAQVTQHLERRELPRVRACLAMVPPAHEPGATLVDIGASTFFLPAYKALGYDRLIVVTKLRETARLSMGDIAAWEYGERVETLYADVDADPLPLTEGSVDVVCLFELLEHLALDPMLVIAEANRVLKPGGWLVMSTPNMASWQSALSVLWGKNPNLWSAYSRVHEHSRMRHHREYTAAEVAKLVQAGGFTLARLRTADLSDKLGLRMRLWKLLVRCLMFAAKGPLRNRGRNTFIAANKTSPVVSRYPEWLYQDFSANPT